MRPVKNLFLVDDDEIYVFLTKRTIEETNLADQVKIFRNGKEAIDFLEGAADNIELLPEIIFLDITMPILDGWGFIEEYISLKPRLGKKITLYIVSTSVSPADIQRAKEISVVSDFIIKPVTKEKFIDVIKKL
ncbi:MAG TPA: response regulator [Bacteroidia bacterium]|jgi:CheY-like chemotaxis protein